MTGKISRIPHYNSGKVIPAKDIAKYKGRALSEEEAGKLISSHEWLRAYFLNYRHRVGDVAKREQALSIAEKQLREEMNEMARQVERAKKRNIELRARTEDLERQLRNPVSGPVIASVDEIPMEVRVGSKKRKLKVACRQLYANTGKKLCECPMSRCWYRDAVERHRHEMPEVPYNKWLGFIPRL